MHRKHKILLPVGGHVELLETPWQAIVHELAEESGYTIDQLQILQPKYRIKKMNGVVQHPYPLSMNTHDISNDHFHTDIQYAFIAKGEPIGTIEDGESIDIRWLSTEEIKALSSGDIFQNTREVYDFILSEALKNWERVDTTEFLLHFPSEYLADIPGSD